MPTDPAPRGADAPDYVAADGYAEDVDYHHVTEGYTPHIQDFAEWNLARAYLALRSPVPAEATSGAEEVQRVVRGVWFGIAVDGESEATVAVRSRAAAERYLRTFRADALVATIDEFTAALRTPPAPLPREGATDLHSAACYARTAVGEACGIIELGDQRLLASDGPAGGRPPELSLAEWRKLYVLLDKARTRLAKATFAHAAALTPAAQPTEGK